MPFLNPERKPTIRHPHGLPIAVIAAFNVLGEVIPRYFCIEDDNQELFKYKVSAVKSIKDRFMIKEYYCTYDAYGFQYEIILSFDVSRCRWLVA